VNYQNDPTAQKLYAFLTRWIRENPNWAYEVSGWSMRLRKAESVGSSLLNDAEFAEVNLAGLLKSPEGQLIETVVSWILPWPMSSEFKLLVDAITLAAQAKQKNERGLAAGLTAVAAFVLLLIFFSE
jgi:hypothetical protein